jgi:hypothetical protein
MEIVAADLLPDGKELYMVAADADCGLHVMQYDPERKLNPLPIIFTPKKYLLILPNIYRS